MSPRHQNLGRAVPKAPVLNAVRQEFDNGAGISELNLNDPRDPMDSVVPLTGQLTSLNLAEAQMAGDPSSSGGVYPQQVSRSSNEARGAPEIINSAPPKTIQVARFPKDQTNPILVGKQIIDVTADQDWNDGILNHIPDVHAEWGNDEKLKNQRRVDQCYVAYKDIPDFPQLYGWYLIFSLHEPRYDTNTHKIFQGGGIHIHEDIFVAKLRAGTLENGWICYVDMPQEFLSAKSPRGLNLWWTPLVEYGNSMMGSLMA